MNLKSPSFRILSLFLLIFLSASEGWSCCYAVWNQNIPLAAEGNNLWFFRISMERDCIMGKIPAPEEPIEELYISDEENGPNAGELIVVPKGDAFIWEGTAGLVLMDLNTGKILKDEMKPVRFDASEKKFYAFMDPLVEKAKEKLKQISGVKPVGFKALTRCGPGRDCLGASGYMSGESLKFKFPYPALNQPDTVLVAGMALMQKMGGNSFWMGREYLVNGRKLTILSLEEACSWKSDEEAVAMKRIEENAKVFYVNHGFHARYDEVILYSE